ncbi:TadE family protein [Archangium sp.]|jgi:hypothetical protein|uniref:TadE family protein n=1 Tax=Archangium sp. TaxID=1872627 RepID=UPI002ED859D9
MRQRSFRGQATVELALSLLVFVSVLLFGIHFAEVGMMKLRVQQAATAALWDTTGLRMHRFNTAADAPPEFRTSDEMLDKKGQAPGPRAEERFQDFDGRSTGGADGFTQVMTRGSRLSVQCEPARVSPLPQGEAFDRLRVAYTPAIAGGREVDGMACNADARVEVWGMPRSFVDDGAGGIMDVKHVLRPQLRVCAFGRARGGVCQGSVPIALDDWALSGSDESFGRELEACLEGCLFDNKEGNQAYKRTVNRLYDEYNSFETRDFSIPDFIRALFTNDPVVPELSNVPVDERAFRFVFVGEDGPDIGAGTTRPFTFKTREQDTYSVKDYEWATTPYADTYKKAYQRREQCFLGSRCDQSYFDKRTW